MTKFVIIPNKPYVITETHELKVTIDIPIDSYNEFSSTSGVGSFNGVMRKNSTFYHSFFFNSSLVENATFITVALKNFTEDLDLFIFDDSLAAESIRNDDHPEEIVKKLESNTIYACSAIGAGPLPYISAQDRVPCAPDDYLATLRAQGILPTVPRHIALIDIA